MSTTSDFLIENNCLTKYSGCDKDIVIPTSVTAIGSHAFKGRESLTSVTIPEGVTSIGAGAFEGCTSLSSITIPDSVTDVYNAFRGCRGLADEDGWIIIRGILFDYFGSDENVIIPDGVTSIGAGAFFDCRSLKSITIPEGVTSIGAGAFFCCHSLESITIPESLTSIEYEAFEGCDSLSEELWDRIEAIEPYAFED